MKLTRAFDLFALQFDPPAELHWDTYAQSTGWIELGRDKELHALTDWKTIHNAYGLTFICVDGVWLVFAESEDYDSLGDHPMTIFQALTIERHGLFRRNIKVTAHAGVRSPRSILARAVKVYVEQR